MGFKIVDAILRLSPIKIGGYNFKIILRPLGKGADGLTWQSIHS